MYALFIRLLSLAGLLGMFVVANGQEQKRDLPRVFLLNAQNLAENRKRIEAGDKTFDAALARLESDARKALKQEPVSVVTKAVTPPSGDKHDYMSQAPYFWPDPSKPNGLPYLRRDGERNPEIDKINNHQVK